MSSFVLITGGSSGIGFELAKLFARDDNHLILVAKDAQRLETAAEKLRTQFSCEVITIACDLGKSNAVTTLLASIKKRLGAEVVITTLVNNAGFGDYGPFASSSFTTQTEMIQVNILALTQLTHQLLPQMITQKKGWILNVASTAAFLPGPLMSVYYATKAYVLSFSQAVSEELVGTGVSVTALCPGATATSFESRANLASSKLFKGQLLNAKMVANIGYQGLLAKKRVVVTGWQNQLAVRLLPLVPSQLLTKLVKNAQGTIT